MSNNAEPLERLIEQFSKFPGVGRKGATRMAYQVLSMQPEQAMELSKAIQDAHPPAPLPCVHELHRAGRVQDLFFSQA